MRRNWLVWGMVTAVLLIVAYAWIDGGLRPLREISVPVAMPGSPK
jgi:hypothetical protein